jgi:predicted esterase
MVRTKSLALGIGLLAAAWSGSAAADPGELSPVEIETIGNVFGYWEYLPTAYAEEETWPLFIFLSGIGENGVGTLDPTACANGPDTAGDYLCRNLRHGPQNLLWRQIHEGEAGLWDDVERPFVVISPQNPAPLFEYTAYDVDDLDDFVQFLLDTYSIDPRRMYLVGMSMGGYSTVLSIIAYPQRFSAVSMMPGIAGAGEWNEVCTLTEQNMWVFHGEVDTNPFPPSGMVSFGYLFGQCSEPVPTPRITVYTDAGHNVWTRTIEPEIGLGTEVLDTFFAQGTNIDLDPYDVDLYTWLLAHDKPVVDAGPDVETTTDDALVQLQASALDDDPVTYAWTQTAGAAVTLANEATDTLDVSGFDVGEYSFEVLVVDADDQHARDDVTLTIVEAPVGGSTTTESSGVTTSSATSSGDGSTAEAESTASPTSTSATSTSAGPSTAGNEATGSAATTAATAGSTDPADPSAATTDDTGTGTGAGSDEPAATNDGGCSCTTQRTSPPAELAFAVLLLATRRRSRPVRR